MARGRTGRKTDYTWNGTTFGNSIGAATSTLLSVAVVGGAGTVMRTRGAIVASIDGEVDGDKVAVMLGIKTASDDQVAAGATAFATPSADMDADWLWHGGIMLQSQAASNEHQAVGRLEIDSKAMRRVKQNQQVVLIVTPVSLAGTPSIDVTGYVRILFGS